MPQEYPTVRLPNEPRTASVSKLRPNSVLRLAPNRALWKAQDSICGQARRVLAEYGLSGSSTWAVPAGTSNPTNPTQTYPERDTWCTRVVVHARQTAGTKLEMRVLFCPAGLTQWDMGPGGWASGGAFAEIRAHVTWDNGSDVETRDFVLTMPGSNRGTWGGAENTEAGSDWADLDERVVENIMPVDHEADPVVTRSWCENVDVTIELQVRGGERVVHASVYEVPSMHVQQHDDPGPFSVHGAPQGEPALPRRPQTDAADGGGFGHERWGTTRVLQTLERQATRLGPRLLHCSANSHSGNDWDETQQVPFSVSGSATPLRNLFDVTLSGYNANHPGWIVAGSMAQLHRLNATHFLRDRACIVPVRVVVDADYNTTASTLRLQSGTYEWVDVPLPSTRGEVVEHGYLQAQVYGDHFAGILLPLITVPSGATATVYNISVEFWEG